MQYSQCKCGYRQVWSSGMVAQPCEVCSKCNTTVAFSPNSHQKPEPHEYRWKYNEYTGKKSYLECQKCYKSFKPDKFDVEAIFYNNKDLVKLNEEGENENTS